MRYWLLAASLLFGQAANAAIARVQKGSAEGSSVTSISYTTASPTVIHNTLVVFVRFSSTTATVSLADTSGNTFTQAAAAVQTSDSHQCRIFYAPNITGGSDTITATFNASNLHPWIAVFEYSGIDGTSPLDQIATATGSGTAVSIGPTPTTTTANELVFVGVGLNSVTTASVTPTGGYTGQLSDTGTSHAFTEDAIISATGAQTGTGTISTSENWSGVMTTFKAGPPPAGTSISLVQSNVNFAGNNGTSSTPASTPTIGNYMVVFCGQYESAMTSSTTMSFSDNYGNVYHLLARYWDSINTGLLQAMAIAKITSTGSGFAATCTNSSGASTLAVTYTAEYAGLSLVADQVVTQNYSSGSSNSCSSITTSTSDEAIIFAVVSNSISGSWAMTSFPTGFTQRQTNPHGNPGFASSFMDRFVTSSGTVAILNFANSDTTQGGNCMAVSLRSATTYAPPGFGGFNNPLTF